MCNIIFILLFHCEISCIPNKNRNSLLHNIALNVIFYFDNLFYHSKAFKISFSVYFINFKQENDLLVGQTFFKK